ncbi:protein of unknown function [Methylocella tundrae]|uniref:Uncharacterized protein n=1 Tax=Methylocella tundrae TaxID=227605 RepID=A0A4U8Z3P4_METTU|nr:protein of unknown function [Methylocella tundrae]
MRHFRQNGPGGRVRGGGMHHSRSKFVKIREIFNPAASPAQEPVAA